MNTRIKAPLNVQALDAAWQQVFSDEPRQPLSELCALAKDSRAKARLNEKQERGRLANLLEHSDPKTRKNAARLLGALYRPEDAPALERALYKEQTRIVVPSLILAIGQGADERAFAVLSRYRDGLSEPAAEEEKKHHQEILAALSAAISKCRKAEVRSFTGFRAPRPVVLTTHSPDLLLQEAKEKGIELLKKPLGVSVRTADYESLFALRCFEEALIPLGDFPALQGNTKEQLNAWAKETAKAANAFVKLLEEVSTGDKPYAYRIELRCEEGMDRTAMIRALAAELRGVAALENAPSGYMAELRIIAGKNTRALAKLSFAGDPRFAYRVKSVAASIHPATAACIMELTRKYRRPNARVLDPCCGSGTLLMEREKTGAPCAELVGVDIDSRALAIARENAAAADSKAQFIGGDSTKFRPKAPFDELYANLPFGTRVGTHDANMAMYKGLIARLDTLLSPDGFAAFYTTQIAAVSRLCERAGYEVAERYRFSAGGLLPYCLIVQKRR